MKSNIERLMARRQVRAEIESDPSVITLMRKTKEDDNTGGWRWSDPTPVAEERVLLTTSTRRLSSVYVNTELGDVVDYPFLLLALDPANIQRGDTFIYNGKHYEVRSIHLDEGISLTAQVDYFGSPSDG